MATGPRFGFYYTIASVPLTVAGTILPDILPLSYGGKVIVFIICVAMALLGVLIGAIKELKAEAVANHEPGHARRMIAIAGILFCGIGFVSFVTAYFWPSKTTPQSTEASSRAALPSTTSDGGRPDVILRFVGKERPGVVLENVPDVLAREIKWTVWLWNMDDPRTYVNPAPPTPDTHDPLPIPTEVFDFLRPKSAGLPQDIFSSPLVFKNVKAGQHLFGSASVVCPECTRGHTYVVSIDLGVGGWFYEVPGMVDGNLLTPGRSSKDSARLFENELLEKISPSLRIPISDRS